MNETNKLNALDIADDLPGLWEKHPNGFTIKDLQDRTGLSYHSAHGAIVWLASKGRVKWITRPDRVAGYVVPPGWQASAWDLTEKQQKALDWLLARADETNRAQASFRDITRGAALANGGIAFVIDVLERKGYMQTITAGRGRTKSIFQLYPQGDGPQGYSPNRFR